MSRCRDGDLLPLVLLGIALCLASCDAGVPLTHYEAVMLQQQLPKETGLYNASDKVNVLNNVNFNSVVLAQSRSVLVEFYNSYCGHCKRFAPFYKELAAQLHPWREVLLVTAIDCAIEENNGICREYEVMAYPTLRYFSPGFAPAEKSYGQDLGSLDVDQLRGMLAQLVAAENRTLFANNYWPNFSPLTEAEVAAPFAGLPEHVQLLIGVHDADNASTVATETLLHFVQWPDVSVRHVADAQVAAALGLDGSGKHKLATVDRAGHITPYSVTSNNASRAAIETIESILAALNIQRRRTTPTPSVLMMNTTVASSSHSAFIAHEAVLTEVQRAKHAVYQADLELAIRVILFNEVPKSANISVERAILLTRFLQLLNNYNPLGANGQEFVGRLKEHVLQSAARNHSVDAKDYETELHRLERELQPVFAPSVGYVGCAGSRPGLRGYTCSLWTLFHYLTVQAATSDKVIVKDPQEVLRVIWGYVKYFFGCTECSEHFQELAERERIWTVSGRDSAILWLWSAHNDVNKRLAGDTTEDPQFHKRQFPTIESCPACYKTAPPTPEQFAAGETINWNRDAVLAFLKDIYSVEKISRFGLDEALLQRAVAENLRQKRMIGISVFSEMDMRMGMLLYGFCIVMMVVAFKLFVFKGYRKKPYGHDMLGKV